MTESSRRLDELTPMESLRAQLELQRSFHLEHWVKQLGYAYAGAVDFVLQHGEEFESAPIPKEYQLLAPKLCFANALLASELYGLTYVEGYASYLGFPVHHAWNVDDEGRLIDLTWAAIENETARHVPIPNSAYLGVRFSAGRAYDAQWDGDASILDDWHRKWPILMDPWEGEDWDREWTTDEEFRSQLTSVRQELGS